MPDAAAFRVTELAVAACSFPLSLVYEEAVRVMFPLTADGVMVALGVNTCRLKAYLGMVSNVIVEAVQFASVAPRTMVVGCRSGCTTIRVSADCVQHMSSTMDEVMLVVR